MKKQDKESSVEEGTLDFAESYDPTTRWEDHKLTTWDRTSILLAIGQLPTIKPFKISNQKEINTFLKSILKTMIKEKISDWDKFKSFPSIPNCTKWEHFRKYTLYEAKKRNKALGVNDSL